MSSFPCCHVHSMMFKITALNEFGNNFSLTLSFSWISLKIKLWTS